MKRAQPLCCVVRSLFFLFLFYSSFSFADTIPNFGQVSEKLYRGSRLTQPMDYEQLVFYGVHAVVNLENLHGDDLKLCSQYHLDCQAFPISIRPGVHGDRMFDYDMLEKALEFVVRSLNQGETVYIHCHYGKDRTGVLAAAWVIRENICLIPSSNKDLLWQSVQADLLKYGFHFNWYTLLENSMKDWIYNPPPWLCYSLH